MFKNNSMPLIYLVFLNNFAADFFQLHSELTILLKNRDSYISNLIYIMINKGDPEPLYTCLAKLPIKVL